MSRFEIKMPKLGESITEGTIISWSVQVGDIIKEDDVLFEVNTAKVSAEIPSPVEGKVVEILFKEGDTVAVGTVVAIVDIGGENSEDEDSVEVLQSSATDESVAVISKAVSEETPQVKAVKSEEERWYSPVVLQLAREAGIQPKELDTIPGTGYQGRVSKKDINLLQALHRNRWLQHLPSRLLNLLQLLKYNVLHQLPAHSQQKVLK